MTNEADRGMLQLDPREEAIRQCVFALAGAARTLLECELSMKAHPESSVAYNRRRAEDALGAMGVTWCPQRGWVQAVLPAGAVPLRDERLASAAAPAAQPATPLREVLSDEREVKVMKQALAMLMNQDLCHWSDAHDAVTIAALRSRLDGEKT